jgi:hypothetical protein
MASSLRFRLALVAVAAAGLLLGSALAPSVAGAAPCKRLTLKTSKQEVRSGGAVRVRGNTCRGERRVRRVRILMRKKHGWRVVARSRTTRGGRFSKRVRIRVPRRAGVARLRAVSTRARSRSIEVRVEPPPVSAPGPAAPVEDPGAGAACALGGAPAPVGMTLPGCRVIASDTSSRLDPRGLWGEIECGLTWGRPDLSRHRVVSGGADPHLAASGGAQGDDSYRRLTAFDGDDYYGERCELGRNDHRTGPTAFYREGQRRITYLSMRLPANLPLDADTWQTVMQMKQAQPADGGGGVPILFMGAYRGEWHVESSQSRHGHWSFPARSGVWTRFAWDVYYSQDPGRGWLQVSADLNADGDFDDPEERSPLIRAQTLKTETSGSSSDGLAAGDPIPSHLRVGLYHNDSVGCPAPTGCSTEVDNVQVVAP